MRKFASHFEPGFKQRIEYQMIVLNLRINPEYEFALSSSKEYLLYTRSYGINNSIAERLSEPISYLTIHNSRAC